MYYDKFFIHINKLKKGGDSVFRYIMKRIGYMFITLFIVISVVFFLVRLLPGTPFNEEKLNAEQIAQLQAQYG